MKLPDFIVSAKELQMDTEHNLEIFRRVIEEIFNQEKYEVLPELFEPDFVEHQFGLHPTFEGITRDIQFLHKAFPDLHLTIEDIAADGDKVWGRMTARGTNLGGLMGPPNGKSFEITVMDEVRFKNGKIVEHWGSPDRFAQLHQLGLLPSRQPA
jgi:predicted ester cyclase